MKRILTILLALSLLLQTTACAVESKQEKDAARFKTLAAETFSDVSEKDWYAEGVGYCLQEGLMAGTSGTTFSPQDTTSRAMLVTVLYRQAGSPAVTARGAFTDVSGGAWYANAVAWAAEKGIVNGYGDGRFGGNDPVTREQFVAVLWRSEGSPAPREGERFADQEKVSRYASDAVAWAKGEGIVTGVGGNDFAPKANISRGEAATMLYRWLYTAGEEPVSTPEPTPGSASGSRPSDGGSPNAGGNFGGGASGSETVVPDPTPTPVPTPTPTPTPTPDPTPVPSGSRVLVAYFSATNTTRPLAEHAADILGADLYEILPQEPYTAADLAYYTGGRADQEQNDPAARPAISGSVEDMAGYDVVLLGYPIWHGQAPRIISTFLESYDLGGKTIVPFCTSHSSGIGSSDTDLHALAEEANWLPGRRFPGGTSRSTMEDWINGLDLPKPQPEPEEDDTVGVFDLESRTVMLNSGYTMPINGLGTYSLHGDTCVNAVRSALASGVRLIDTAHMYGNEEEIGRAIRESMEELGIEREEIFVITKIYPGSDMADPEAAIQACLDRLDIGYVDMMLLHHPDPNDVKAYQAMERFVAEGKIRSIGLSNWYVEELETFLPQVDTVPALVQNEIHPYYQENDVIPYIQSLGIVVQGWYPLGGRGHTGELLGDQTISDIARSHGVSSAQVILRWDLQKGVVVIPGSSDPDHIRENTELYHFELTEEEMARINALDRGEKHDWY